MYRLLEAADKKIGLNELQQRLVKAGHKVTLDALYKAIERKSAKIKTSLPMINVLQEVLGKKEFDRLISKK